MLTWWQDRFHQPTPTRSPIFNFRMGKSSFNGANAGLLLCLRGILLPSAWMPGPEALGPNAVTIPTISWPGAKGYLAAPISLRKAETKWKLECHRSRFNQIYHQCGRHRNAWLGFRPHRRREDQKWIPIAWDGLMVQNLIGTLVTIMLFVQ